MQIGFDLSPKEDKGGLGCSKDGRGVGLGKLDGCGHGECRDEQQCTLHCFFLCNIYPCLTKNSTFVLYVLFR